MKEKRSSLGTTVLAIVGMLAVPLLFYIGGYFFLSERIDFGFAVYRAYRWAWVANAYKPLASIEEVFVRTDVQTVCDPDGTVMRRSNH